MRRWHFSKIIYSLNNGSPGNKYCIAFTNIDNGYFHAPANIADKSNLELRSMGYEKFLPLNFLLLLHDVGLSAGNEHLATCDD